MKAMKHILEAKHPPSRKGTSRFVSLQPNYGATYIQTRLVECKPTVALEIAIIKG